MNHEAKLIYLRNMLGQVRQQRMDLITTHVKPDSTAYNTLMTKIDGWERAVATMNRDLKSASHFAGMQFQHSGQSYPEKQRHDSRQNNVATLKGITLQISHELAHIVQQAGGAGHERKVALEGLKHAIKKIMDANESAGEEITLGPEASQLQTTVSQLTNEIGGTPQMPVIGPVNAFTLLLSLFALWKAMQKK